MNPSLPESLRPILDDEPGPRSGVLAHQHAVIWLDRIVEVEVEPADGTLGVGEYRTWAEGPVIHHVRCARFARAELPAPKWDRYPVFLALALTAGVPVGVQAILAAKAPASFTVEVDEAFVGRIAFADIGLPDVNPDAGRGPAQRGDGGDAGDPTHLGIAAQGEKRNQAREAVEGTPGLAGGSGPNLNEGSGRVEEIAPGLTSTTGGAALASGIEGVDEGGVEGQLQSGAGPGAEGTRASLSGLSAVTTWLHRGRGLMGPGDGPGADRDGLEDGQDGVAYLSSTPRGYVRTQDDPTSYFSLDVDRASYAQVRGALSAGHAVDADAVRPEEIVNAMPLGLDGPGADIELAEHADGAWLRVSVQLPDERDPPPLDLVLMIDDSCSMQGSGKIELARLTAVRVLNSLGPEDRVQLVTFQDPEPLEGERAIRQRLDELGAGGASPLAWSVVGAARAVEDPCHGCRPAVLVLADGGADYRDVPSTVHHGVADEVAVAVIGFGASGFDAETLEELALVSGGTWHFVDNEQEAARLASNPHQLLGALDAPALHVRFGDAVESWRLVGYGNRQLAESSSKAQATVQAGRIGGGSQATALYELDLRAGEVVADIELRGAGAPSPLGRVTTDDLGDASDATVVAWSAAQLGEYLSASPFAPADLADVEAALDGARFDPAHDELLQLVREAD